MNIRYRGVINGKAGKAAALSKFSDRLTLSQPGHSSLVDYLAQVIYAKKCPTTFYCIFHLVWVPMTTTKNIRVCFLSSLDTFFIRVPPLEKI